MTSWQQMQERREKIAHEMLAIKSMKRGTLNEQYLSAHNKNGEQSPPLGPYYVFSRKQNGKTVSKRVPANQVEAFRLDIERHRRFGELCREFEELTERMGAVQLEEGVSQETLKKGLKSRSRRTGKSSAS